MKSAGTEKKQYPATVILGQATTVTMHWQDVMMKHIYNDEKMWLIHE